jgi:glutaconate CoA-transferase, subunit A
MQSQSKLVSLDSAAALIRTGQLITLGGTLSQRIPAAFVRELARRRLTGLRLVKSSPGYDVEILAAAGCLASVQCGIASLEQPIGMSPSFRRAAQDGTLKVIEAACPGVMAGLQAAAFGLPFMAVAGVNDESDVVKSGPFAKVIDPFTGNEAIVTPAIKPDWAVLHVHEADDRGNARIYGSPVWDRLMSRAATKVILTAERIMPTSHFEAQPEMTTISELFVEAVVHAPQGAMPTSMYPEYPLQVEQMEACLELVSTQEGLEAYLEQTALQDRMETATCQ